MVSPITSRAVWHLVRRGGTGRIPDITRGGNRDDDGFLVHIHANKSCRLFHDPSMWRAPHNLIRHIYPSPVPEAPRQPIRRDPRSLQIARRVTPSGRPQSHPVKGNQANACKHRLVGSKGSALGGSRAEPWSYFPSLGSPGPETDMRSSAPIQPSSREPRTYPNDINSPHDFECSHCCRTGYHSGAGMKYITSKKLSF